MRRSSSHHEMQELLAAYAIDAVEADEAEAIELHLRECPRCRGEVAEHRETVALLASGHAPAPIGVWEPIAASLDEKERPLPTLPVAPIVPIHSRRQQAARVAVASIAAAVIGLLGLRVVDQGHQLDQVQGALQERTLLSSALAAQGQPDARRVALRSGNGVVLAHAVMTSDGTGFVWADGLPPTAPDRTYQLWAVLAGEKISAGVLGTAPNLVPFRASGDVAALAITEERAGGVVATDKQPVVTGLL